LSGAQYELALRAHGRQIRGVITGVGAALRDLSVGGVALTPGFDGHSPAPFYCGKVLVPWPNRVRDGRWTHNGHTLQLAVNDTAHRTALHGLLSATAHLPVARCDSSITLAAPVLPQGGYPFHLETQVCYQLTADGLMTTHSVHNAGWTPAPVGVGAHPFLAIGDVSTETLTLTIDGTHHVDVDCQLIPIGVTAVEGTEWDLRGGRLISDLHLDDSWAVQPGRGGGSTHTLSASDGRSVSLWADDAFGVVHAFITREFPRGGGFMTAVALEPMTARADALNTGAGMRWLQPGKTFSASWAIHYDDGSRT
jgi:aldose 1-epimerase